VNSISLLSHRLLAASLNIASRHSDQEHGRR
jgi:hypothetical protein